MNNAVTRDIYPYLDKRWFNLIQVWYLTSGAFISRKRNINKKNKDLNVCSLLRIQKTMDIYSMKTLMSLYGIDEIKAL